MKKILIFLLLLISNLSFSQQVIEQCDGYRSEYTYYAQSNTQPNQYHWTIDYNGDYYTSTKDSIDIKFIDSGLCKISVYIEDINYCKSLIQTYEIVIIPCKVSTLFIPNSFTPNSDGKNDIFSIKYQNIYNLEFVLYNRWGQSIFTSNGDIWWDGDNCPQGVYYYVVTYYDIKDIPRFRSGNITLLR